MRPPFRVVDNAAVIGSDDVTELRVDLTTGHVSSVEPGGAWPARFVNSSVNQLGAATAAYLSYAARVRGVRDEDVARLMARELRDRIGSIDAAAVADPEAWWAVVLEQAEDGLL